MELLNAQNCQYQKNLIYLISCFLSMWIFDGDIKRLHEANLSDTGDVELAGKYTFVRKLIRFGIIS